MLCGVQGTCVRLLQGRLARLLQGHDLQMSLRASSTAHVVWGAECMHVPAA